MTKQIKAMQAALTALKSIDAAMPFPVAKFAIHHLEEALAEQESGIKQVIELYDSPDQPSQQEPVACVIDGDLYFHHEIDWEDLAYQGHGVELLYTSPPASKPLTDEEIADLWSAQIFHINDLKLAKDFVRDIEAAHGIKGNA